MIDFNMLRTQRGNNMASVQKALEKTEGSNYEDPLIWKYTRDTSKDISMNVIRFLPPSKADMQAVQDGKFPPEDLSPLVKLLRYSFRGANGWLNALSRLTFGEEDPIKEWSMPQWIAMKGLDKEAPDVKAKREKLKEFIASSEYYANILVINDAQKPENNGKVFKFKFGEGIRKIIDTASEPKFPTDPKFDPFCPWTGANLELNLSYEKRKFNGKDSYVPEFKAVKWSAPAPVGDDAFIEKLWNESHSLLDYLDRSKYPTQAELKAKFCKVMNFDENYNPVQPGSSLGKESQSFLNGNQSAPAPAAAPAAPSPAPAASTPAPTPAASTPAPAPSSGDSELDELERLMRG